MDFAGTGPAAHESSTGLGSVMVWGLRASLRKQELHYELRDTGTKRKVEFADFSVGLGRWCQRRSPK